MEYREYGRTGMRASVLGFGAGHIGGETDESEVARLLHRVLDLGITLLDTARGYGLSEERIGRHLAGRRDEFLLSTKVGYGVDGVPDWTGECVRLGIERALRLLNTDRLDIVHLHSCPLATLEQGEVVRALQDARAAGKVRAVAYSGDNEPLEWAAASGLFDGVETSCNICDQRVIGHGLAAARAAGLGVIAKRPLANAPWRHAVRPAGEYVEVYWERFRAMGFDTVATDWQRAALLFSCETPGVTSAIIGSRSIVHLEENVRLLAGGPLEPGLRAMVEAAFAREGGAWRGEV